MLKRIAIWAVVFIVVSALTNGNRSAAIISTTAGTLFGAAAHAFHAPALGPTPKGQ